MTEQLQTRLITDSISYGSPQKLGVKFDTYQNSVNKLINKLDVKTVGARSSKELQYQYNNCIIAVLDNEIIGHAACIDTNQFNTGTYRIGEIETVLIDQDIQCNGIGKQLLSILDQNITKKNSNYDAIIMATLHPAMRHICTRYLGYIDLKTLPHSFATEGKRFFVESGRLTKEEFNERATTLIRYKEKLEFVNKNDILSLFLNS